MRNSLVPALYLLIALTLSCGGGPTEETIPVRQGALLHPVSPDSSGVRFANTITESPDLNYFTYIYAYNGAGVAVGDVNNDGLQDLYFTGNQVADRLYLNKGGMKFEDVTERSIGATAGAGWRTGVCMADVNADGWLDIYVCRSGPSMDTTLTRNLFYLNKGDGSFRECAYELGIADTTHSTQASFSDFDGDGDLDLYVMNTPHNRMDKMSNLSALTAVIDHKAPTDRLYRNDNGHFTDITYDADVQNYAYGLGLSTADMDQDGRPDIYTSCDFDSPDLMYFNRNKEPRPGVANAITSGTGPLWFAEELQKRTHHISNFGMGCDVADYNNDGLPDICVLDMTADDHKRNKTNMGSMSPARFWANVRGGYFFQYMVNTLQLNNGNGTWSEVGQMAGIARTDWSWAPLFCDLDNDGWKDLMVTNGFKHDVRDNDYSKGVYNGLKNGGEFYDKLDLIPSTKLRNYLFRNNGDLTFADSSQAWGFNEPLNSNGAAYADLDNDGDLDLVINNIDDPAALFENTADRSHHWLRVDPRNGRVHALGTAVTIWAGGQKQYQELAPVRGYQSCVEPILHFGLGASTSVDSIEVRWPGGSVTHLAHVEVDQVLQVNIEQAKTTTPPPPLAPNLFEEMANSGILWKHKENDYFDFTNEVLLPHQMSLLGPQIGAGDVNGDGLDDLFFGGASGQSGILMMQDPNGTFYPAIKQPWRDHLSSEELGSVFFDADGDKDLDLLVLAGSNEHDLRTPEVYAPRLYLNGGTGNFTEAVGAMPPQQVFMTSAMRGAAADVDGDGDQDLFIGGRITPAMYPAPPRSYLLINDGKGHFADGTQQLAPALMGPGLVTDVRFADMDGDRDPDLLLCGEWMRVMQLRNDGGHFTDVTKEVGLDQTSGWWYSIAVADVNGDGYMDIIGGNLGWNSKFKGSPEHPIHVYYADFDDNGRSDIVLAKEKGGQVLPVRGRECSSQQCPMITQKFPTYKDFANADLTEIYSPERLSKALHYQATMMKSTVFLNDGKGHYTAGALPLLAQTAPINAILPMDVDGDGKLDLVVAGNNYGAEVETVRYDSGTGLVLRGDGKGGFSPMPIARSGFFAWGNVKDLALIRTSDAAHPSIVVANNSGAPQVFRLR